MRSTAPSGRSRSTSSNRSSSSGRRRDRGCVSDGREVSRCVIVLASLASQIVTQTLEPVGAARPTSVAAPRATPADLWWRDAVIYQVYVRSFADGNGDGVGDLAGVRSRLRYLKDLGVDAIWFTPWYASPLADGGYDVADYRRIHPSFGTLED